MSWERAIHPLLAIMFAPLLFGIINKTKACFGGRKGVPWLQLYYDVFKLLRKGAVYSKTTTWIFRTGPTVGLAAVFVAILILPCAGVPGSLSFSGDLMLFVYLFGLMRFVTMLAALDTGSSFEGMGASREAWFATLAELPLFLCLIVLAQKTAGLSLTAIYGALSWQVLWANPGLLLVAIALFVVFLTENARIPVDDPNTHLELTMIHEVMVLDHGGPDFAFILYGVALKLWALGTLAVGMFLPTYGATLWINIAYFLGGMMLLAVVVGIVESITARIKLINIPQLLIGAATFAILALCLR